MYKGRSIAMALIVSSLVVGPANGQVIGASQPAAPTPDEEVYSAQLERLEREGLINDNEYLQAALRLALLYGNSGRHAEAVPLLRKALTASAQLHGGEHPVTRQIEATLLLTEGYLRNSAPPPLQPPLASDSRVFTRLQRIGGTITLDDYPIEALRVDAEGTVGVEVGITAEGRVERCFVTLSSGNASLDQATCALIRERFTYAPPTVDGRPVPTGTSERVVWRVPDD